MNIECIILQVIPVDEMTTILWIQATDIPNAVPIPFPVFGKERKYHAGEHYWLDIGRLFAEWNTLVYIAQQKVFTQSSLR